MNLLDQGNRTFRANNEAHKAAERLSVRLKHFHSVQELTALDRSLLQLDVDQLILIALRSILDSEQDSENNPLKPLLAFIEQRIPEKITIEDLEDASGWGRTQLYSLFHRHIGQTPIDYIQSIRCDHACKRLKEGSDRITDISFDLGFSSSQYFSRIFKKYIGLSPGEFRRLMRS